MEGEKACDTVSTDLSTRMGDLRYSARFKGRDAVVLHHSEPPWKTIPSVRGLIEVPQGIEGGDILGLPIRLIDVAAMSVDELHGHPMVCALLKSLQSASMGILPSRMRDIFARLRGLGGEERIDSWVAASTRYYYSERHRSYTSAYLTLFA